MKSYIAAGLVSIAFASPALAQQEALPPATTISANTTLVSDYRFRGISHSNKRLAIQGGVSVEAASGIYGAVWASSVAGWGSRGGANAELNLIGGYRHDLGGIILDGGLRWYMFPGGAKNTDFAEPFANVSADIGPAHFLVGVAYAPKQKALGNYYATPGSHGQKKDNVYVYSDAAFGIPTTPVTVKAHLGYSDGNPGLSRDGTSLAPTGSYVDWSLGAEAAVGPLTVGLSYIDTNISKCESAYLQPEFASTRNGSQIAGATGVLSLSAGF